MADDCVYHSIHDILVIVYVRRYNINVSLLSQIICQHSYNKSKRKHTTYAIVS